jgi:Flp pilus assembly protein TadG
MQLRMWDNERGATLAIVAISMFLFLGLAALAIDLGMIKASAAQAQRAADAAALAGASAFIDYANSDATIIDSAAQARAIDYATRHQIRTTPIDPSEVTVTVIDADFKVRVAINRASVPTWFANTLGISSVSVGRTAAAVASDAGVTANCIKPFLLPDRWHETDTQYEDLNSNQIMDVGTAGSGGGPPRPGEAWFYQPAGYGPQGGDTYVPYNASSTDHTSETGFGSGASGLPGDRGLSLLIKPQTGSAQRNGAYYQVLDPSAYGLASDLRSATNSGCISASVGDTAYLEPGSRTGPARQGVQDLLAMSPDVTWDDASGHPTATTAYPDWTANPRTIVVALYSPLAIATDCDASTQNGCANVATPSGMTFTNFARVFLEADPGNTGNVTARFIGFLGGGGVNGSQTGPLIKVLRLVE